MNNNNNGNKGKESDISTKKGFLISLPDKKKNTSDAGASSINLAKPQSDVRKNDNKPEGTEKKNSGKNRHDRNRNKHNKKHDNRGERNDAVNEVKQQSEKPAPKKEEKQAHGQNNNDFSRDRRDRNKKNKHASHNNHNNHNNNNNNNNHNKGSHQEKNFENRQAAKNENRNDVKRDNKQSKPLLSSLSGDISAEIKNHSREKVSEAPVMNELSLEEKYKNAKPLREQIAEQEMRQKGMKIPYDNNVAQVKAEEGEKQEIVGVRFREAGKIYYFDPAGMTVPFGAPVIVETARGSEYGFTAISNRMIPSSSLSAPLKKIERLATPMDTQKHEANKLLEKDAEKVFVEKVEKLNLAMNLIYVEYTFDNSRLLFYFTAETRIDFRELVKELAGVFRTRIELRQIGVRDEAKMIGGLGVCGRATCCNTFLGDFAQVSIKMAKDQSLSLNAAKISGACGKLMCCLRYEDKVYEEENARTPKVGSIVETTEGKGVVTERNALKGIVNVQLELTPEAPAKPFPREEVVVIGFNKEKGDDDIDSEELKKLQDS